MSELQQIFSCRKQLTAAGLPLQHRGLARHSLKNISIRQVPVIVQLNNSFLLLVCLFFPILSCWLVCFFGFNSDIHLGKSPKTWTNHLSITLRRTSQICLACTDWTDCVSCTLLWKWLSGQDRSNTIKSKVLHLFICQSNALHFPL